MHLAIILDMKSQGALHQTISKRRVWPHGITLHQKTSGGIQKNTRWYIEMNMDSEKLQAERLTLINNESVTCCTDRGCQLRNGGIQLVFCMQKAANENWSGQQPHLYSIMMKSCGSYSARSFFFVLYSVSRYSHKNMDGKDAQK